MESATNSIVIKDEVRSVLRKEYVIERDLAGLNMSLNDLLLDFNPYIITVEYKEADRVEVHLPLKDMISAANAKLMNKDNAYFVSRDGKSPFAINIPIKGFKPAEERHKIDEVDQYPSFAKWVNSGGKEYKDWYKQDKGQK